MCHVAVSLSQMVVVIQLIDAYCLNIIMQREGRQTSETTMPMDLMFGCVWMFINTVDADRY